MLSRRIVISSLSLGLACAFFCQTPAMALLKICNQTSGRIAVALGHNNTKSWLSEGWWQIDAHKCATLIEGPLIARYYYLYSVSHDTGEKWGGDVSMCTSAGMFTIRGRSQCEKRGFSRAGFREIDTGEYGDWTEYLATIPNH